LTFADAAEKVRVGESGHSMVPTEARDKISAERLHPKVANWRCRPIAELRKAQFNAAKRSFSMADPLRNQLEWQHFR
jgi:extradiol dioxygenase family protein